MASMFPILFGAPSFGNEERDQWVRVLQLFLADPFAPHAVNVGGTTQVSYGWTVPAGAIDNGNAPDDRYNNFGIREYNPFPIATAMELGDIVTISDRPGLLFVFGEPDNNLAIFSCGISNVQVLVSADPTDFATYQGASGTFNCYWDSGDSRWKVENNFPSATDFYMAFMSLGAQV